jgi:DNA-binding GntR family transcriptional regulator
MRVFERLRDWIETGVLAPGEILRDYEIADRLGTSRTPVREALQMLELLNAVETTPSRHTRVSSPSPQDAEILLPPFAALHAVAVENAAGRIDEGLLAELHGQNERLLAAARGGDAVSARAADEAFHSALVERAENRFIDLALAQLRLHWRRYNGLYFTHIAPSEKSFEEHREIIAALREGDGSRAAELTRRNLLRPIR